jgi:hypothetical protein
VRGKSMALHALWQCLIASMRHACITICGIFLPALDHEFIDDS